MKDQVVMLFPAVSENEVLARSFSAAYAARLDPTLRELEDIRTAVSEAVTNVVVHAYPKGEGQVRMEFARSGMTLVIQVTDEGIGIENVERAREALFTSKPAMERSGLGFTVMEAFMDSVEVVSAPGAGTTVVLKKRIGRGKSMSN